MTSNLTRRFQTTPQEQRCLLSLLCFSCTSVSKVKICTILCLLCLLNVLLGTFTDISSWKNSWTVAFGFGVNKSHYNSIPVRAIHGYSHFDNYVNSWNNQEPLKIAIWTSPNLDLAEYRTNELRKFVFGRENRNPCFRIKFKCEMTMNTGNLQMADAIIFFMYNKGFLMDELPPGWQQWRKPDQIWVLHAHEAPPQLHPKKRDLLEVFNWSISYRRDSDIWLPYGRVVPTEQTGSKENWTKQEIFIRNIPLSKWISSKSKLVAGVITNCDTSSRRERFVWRLKKTGKPVHIYGGGSCSDIKINCNFYLNNCDNFWTTLGMTYKFYLAFENSLCVDYITEKFWRTLEFGMVPVVYGGADYSKVMPPGSFIDVRDFGSSSELMNYLEEVGRNDTEYAKYFEWRRNFKLAEGNSWNNGNAWCELCEKLRKFKHLYNFDGNATNGTVSLPDFQNSSRKRVSARVGRNWWKEVPDKNGKGGKYACQNTSNFQRFLENNVLSRPSFWSLFGF